MPQYDYVSFMDHLIDDPEEELRTEAGKGAKVLGEIQNTPGVKAHASPTKSNGNY
jgi:hypothetical protein